VREIVIVIRDLYLEPELAAEASAPGIELLARFGDKAPLPEGWRAWTAQWLGVPRYADAAPASVAAAALEDAPANGAVWLATPVHLIAGLTSVHFDRRSVLRLPDTELGELAASFRDTFRGSGFDLRPLGGGELLLIGPQISPMATTIEPARLLLTSVAEAISMGGGAPALRRLSAEIEMWLHGHAVNDERARHGDLTVATLWLWGGGAPAAFRPAAAPREMLDAAFGSDPYMDQPRAQRALAVMEVAELLQANASWRLADAVTEIDRRLISPALDGLRRGELDRFVLLANDRCLILRRADRWRLWRRMRTTRTGLEGLV
jgi:hypothetical protein